MKKQLTSLTLLAAIFIASPLVGQVLVDRRISAAAAFNDRGRFGEAVRLLEPMVHTPAAPLTRSDEALAWSVLGFSYDNLADFKRARYAYDEALHKLQNMPQLAKQYTSTLDNLSMLELEEGQLVEAHSLISRVLRIQRKSGDLIGAARSSATLALIEMKQGNMRGAKRAIGQGYHEAAGTLENSTEMANLHDIESSLEELQEHNTKAIALLDTAIDIWTHQCGINCYQLAVAYEQRGELQHKLRDYPKAQLDFEHALMILKLNDQWQTEARYYVQVAYAKELLATGDTTRASELERDAENLLSHIQHPCAQCAISIASLR